MRAEQEKRPCTSTDSPSSDSSAETPKRKQLDQRILGSQQRSWKNSEGAWESRTEWHRCVSFGKVADFAAT